MPGDPAPRTRGGPVTLTVADSGDMLCLRPQALVVAGFTGRDSAAVAAHIAELAAIGVPVPASVPEFYRLDPALLTTAEVARVSGQNTSGEVEPVIIRATGRYYLTVGSDHTDRDLERSSIAGSKAACDKPIAGFAVALADQLESIDWDAIEVSCAVDETPYQRGLLGSLRTPGELLALLPPAPPAGDDEGDLVLFCGTLPLLDGHFTAGSSWQLSLRMPDGAIVRHAYRTSATGAT